MKQAMLNATQSLSTSLENAKVMLLPCSGHLPPCLCPDGTVAAHWLPS